jgi:hypothetical protein
MMITRSPNIDSARTFRTFFALCDDTRIEGLAEVSTALQDHENYTKRLSWAILSDDPYPKLPDIPELKVFLLKKIRNMKLEIYIFSIGKEEENALDDQEQLFNIIKNTGVNLYD